MTFVVLLLALLAERFLLDQYDWRQARWLERYFVTEMSHQYRTWISGRYWGALIVLAPPLLLVGLLQGAFEGIAGDSLSFIFAVVVLLYCFGPDDLETQTADFINAEERGDHDNAKVFAQTICQCEPADTPAERMRQVRESVIVQYNQRIFAVILWFLILGPLGAVLYRFSRQLGSFISKDSEPAPYNQGIKQLLHILDWLPTRLMVIAFALVGSFDNTMHRWRKWDMEQRDNYDEEAQGLLINTSEGALMIDENRTGDEEAETAQLDAALSLAWRTLVVWLVLIGFIDFAI